MKTIGTVTAVLIMVVGLVTNTNGKQVAPTTTTEAVGALKSEIGELRKQIEELTRARAADQQTFLDSIRRQEDATKKLISVERSGNRTKQDLRAQQKAMGSLTEGINLGQSLLTNLLTITLAVAGIFIAVFSGLGGIIISEIGKRHLDQAKGILDRKVEHVKDELHEVKDEGFVVTKGLASLTPETPEFELHKSRNELESYLESHPTARRPAIVLARTFRVEKALGKAIAVLDRFVKAKAALKQLDNDYADALYNRACYKTLLAEQTGDVKYKEQAYEDLRKSVEISPTNKMDAQTDKDFESIWKEERFIVLGTK